MLVPLTNALRSKFDEFWWPLTFGLSVAMLILPLILIFTIKQKNAKRNNVQPPRNLQFHDETLAQQISQSHPLQFPEDFIEEADQCQHLQEGLVEEAEQSKHYVICNVPNAVEE